MRLAHDAQVIPVIGSSSRAVGAATAAIGQAAS
jgi:hypothetical protein